MRAPRKLNRRHFAALVAGGALAAPRLAFGARPRLVVVGGGAAGATVARLVGDAGSVSVTLVEPSRRYYSCFGSNLYLGGLRDFETLGHSYERLALNHGVNVVQDWAAGIDRDGRRVTLGSGGTLDYDRLVLAPGIDIRFDAIEGYGVEAVAAMPHAYKSGTQVQLLRQQLEAMRAGGTFVMSVPPLPYKCPPGPYERACMAA
ncbi:MAG: NAD(P)/FAD-dependent oxidoreductase, partial [Microbacteriaceae bacterium]|nr:NAD(P)/FAD-dependent oxidoreductase [Microbacteriaceae bacterium]